MCAETRGQLTRVDSFLLPCKFSGSNSGCQPWQQGFNQLNLLIKPKTNVFSEHCYQQIWSSRNVLKYLGQEEYDQ